MNNNPINDIIINQRSLPQPENTRNAIIISKTPHNRYQVMSFCWDFAVKKSCTFFWLWAQGSYWTELVFDIIGQYYSFYLIWRLEYVLRNTLARFRPDSTGRTFAKPSVLSGLFSSNLVSTTLFDSSKTHASPKPIRCKTTNRDFPALDAGYSRSASSSHWPK